MGNCCDNRWMKWEIFKKSAFEMKLSLIFVHLFGSKKEWQRRSHHILFGGMFSFVSVRGVATKKTHNHNNNNDKPEFYEDEYN